MSLRICPYCHHDLQLMCAKHPDRKAVSKGRCNSCSVAAVKANRRAGIAPDPQAHATGLAGSRKRWGDRPRLLRLSELTDEQRDAIAAVVAVKEVHA